jgi:trehalose 6-phosphate phosphatase
LITDIDGTISPMVDRAADARVLPEARSALAILQRVLDVVAVVTGRSVRDARRMVALEGVVYIGNHGLETLAEDGSVMTSPELEPWVAHLAELMAALEQELQPESSGIMLENKGVSASIHFRRARDQREAERQIMQALDVLAAPGGWRIEPGRMVVNLLPPLPIDKGSAVVDLIRERGLRHVVYAGDDVTDTNAFRAMLALEAAGEVDDALCLSVVGRETAPVVRELGDVCVSSVSHLAVVLERTANALRADATMDTGAANRRE